MKFLSDKRHQPQRNEFAPSLIDALRLLFLNISAPVLKSVRDLRAEQQDRPGEVEAEEKNRNGAE